jgi:hypothetical protein
MTRKAEDHDTHALCDALLMLGLKLGESGLDEAERMTRAVLIDVLCKRHPEADAAFDAWATDFEAYMKATAEEAITSAALAAVGAGRR